MILNRLRELMYELYLEKATFLLEAIKKNQLDFLKTAII